MSAEAESRWPAPAKLNLFLHVTGQRPDGYHDLQTLFQLIDLCDSIGIQVREDGRIERTAGPPGVAEDADLIVRAARALKAASGTPLGATLRVTKRIPMGGGLGGGSSDAATTLVALNRLWETGLTRERLQALALELGADVPVFVFGRNALAEGIGERLTPLEVPDHWYLVLEPPVAVPTARIFADKQLKRDSKPIKITAFSMGQAGNDLEPVVCREYPAVAQHLSWLQGKMGGSGGAWVTGAGACVYAAFPTESAARRVWGELPEGMRGFVARGLARHPLHGLVP